MDSESTKGQTELFLQHMSPRCGLFLSAAFADILSEGLTLDQVNALGSFIAAIGDSMAYIADQMELNDMKIYLPSGI